MPTRTRVWPRVRTRSRGKERTVRRVVKTIQEVKVMLDGMASPPVTASDLSEVLPSGTIPHHFFCPITQASRAARRAAPAALGQLAPLATIRCTRLPTPHRLRAFAGRDERSGQDDR